VGRALSRLRIEERLLRIEDASVSDKVLQRETEATDFAEDLSDEALDRPAASCSCATQITVDDLGRNA
jgi:hypothetical protein